MTTITRFQLNALLRASAAGLAPSSQTFTPNADKTISAVIDRALGSNVTLQPFVDDTQPHSVPLNMADGQEMQISFVGGGGSGSWATWSASASTTPGYVFLTGVAPVGGQSLHVKRVGYQYRVYPGAVASEDMSRFDIAFGNGVDPATRRYAPLVPINAGALIIFYTPSGSAGGPTTATFQGISCSYYTCTTMTACGALTRQGASDWVLFPAQTLTMPVNGEMGYVPVVNGGASLQYPMVFGTYDTSSMLDATLWNKKQAVFDYTACRFPMVSSSFFPVNGTATDNVAFFNITLLQPNAGATVKAMFSVGRHSNFLFERFISDGCSFNFANNANISGSVRFNVVLTSITSVGTTATASVSSAGNNRTFISYLQKCIINGETAYVQVYGATGVTTAYNGKYAITSSAQIDGTNYTFSYTFAGSGNVDAIPTASPPGITPALGASLRVDSIPDAVCSMNLVFNQCSVGFAGSAQGSTTLNVQIAGPTKHLRLYEHNNFHGGWPRNGSRAAAPFAPGSTLHPITSLATSGNVLTAMTPDTTGLVVGGYFYPTHTASDGTYAKLYRITSITTNVSVTCDCDPAAGAQLGSAAVTGYLSGNTLTVVSYTGTNVAIGQVLFGPGITQANITGGAGPFTFDGLAQNVGTAGSPVSFYCCATWRDAYAGGYDPLIGTPPTPLNHGFYLDSECVDVRMYDVITYNDSSNSKLTGGYYYTENFVDIRNPGSVIHQPFGNDNTGAAWASGAPYTMLNHLQVFSTDVTPGYSLSWAPNFIGADATSSYTNGLILNASNPSGSARTGVVCQGFNGSYGVFASYTDGYTPSLTVTHSIKAGWGATGSAPALLANKFYAFNITDDTAVLPANQLGTGASGSNVSNQLAAAAQATFQTALSTALSLDVANTFRAAIPELAGVTVTSGTGVGQGLNNAANLQTEANVMDYIFYHPGDRRWARDFQGHWRAPFGR